MVEIVLSASFNLFFLMGGLSSISVALKDKRRGWVPKWFWILELIVGIIASLFSFTVWFA